MEHFPNAGVKYSNGWMRCFNKRVNSLDPAKVLGAEINVGIVRVPVAIDPVKINKKYSKTGPFFLYAYLPYFLMNINSVFI